VLRKAYTQSGRANSESSPKTLRKKKMAVRKLSKLNEKKKARSSSLRKDSKEIAKNVANKGSR
jgi:hypothetical protein